MTTFKNETHINATPAEVWAVLADFGGIHVFNPGVTESYSLTKKNSGVGAERQCNLGGPDTFIRERIVDWTEGKQFTLEIYEGKKTPPFKNAFTTFTVEPDNGGAKVTAELRYGMKGGPIGWLLDRAAVRRNLGPAMTSILAGLKRHVETGESVSDETTIDLTAVHAVA